MTWLAIDANERPDLVDALTRGSITQRPCRECESLIERRIPLLLTRLSDSVPLIVGPVRDEIPSPAQRVAFEVLVFAAGRNIPEDVAELRQGVSDQEWSEQYSSFLQAAIDLEPLHRVERALTALHKAFTEDDLRRLVTDFPEVTSSLTRERLRSRIA